MPCLGHSPASSRGSEAPALAFTSDFPSAPPQSFLNPPSSPPSGPAGRAPGPLPYLRLLPQPRWPPSTPASASPSSGAGRRLERTAPATQAAGGCGRKQSCLHGCCGFSLPPPRLRPLFLLPSNPPLSQGPAPPSPPRLQDVRIRRSDRKSPAQIESCSTP